MSIPSTPAVADPFTALFGGVRDFELECARRRLGRGLRILELGGGNGHQARVLSSWGHDVRSIDVAPLHDAVFPVQEYDGTRIPFEDASFDVVFSSHVLEHVQDLPALLTDTARVMRKDGMGIHILPSPAWRVWTSIAHYGFIARYLATRQARVFGVPGSLEVGSRVRSRGIIYMLARAALAPRHGERGNVFTEAFYFSARQWKREFRAGGFTVEQVSPTGIFYTGYAMRPRMSMEARQRWSRWIGSSSSIYVVRSRADSEEKANPSS